MARPQSKNLEDLLTEKQIHHILKQSLGDESFHYIASDKRPAVTGLAGFLGDHFRVTLHARVQGVIRKIRLFVKCVPLCNEPKANFINENNYYTREMVALRLAEEMRGAEGPNPWCARVYICNKDMLVMPDLAVEGYRTLSYCNTLDLNHVMLTAASLARFHASFANYATKKTLYDGRPYSFLDDHDHLMKEPTFCDSPWLTAAATLSANFLQTFSVKRDQYPANLKDIIFKMFLEACDTLTEYEETLNVLIHKDLWVNNIMFKYCGDVPVNALLIDFQCMRYGPPAFDLMIFLYLTTARQFRERHEAEIFKHYYTIFCDSLEDATKERLKDLNYDYENFLDWCDRSRMFALFEAVGIFPYVLMEPATAQKTFDDPETYMHYCEVDRTKPVVQHCRNSRVYLERQLEVNEEFVERYVLKQP